MNETWNRCDDCGRFIPMDDFSERKAIHRLVEPESVFGTETWETLCRKCLDKSESIQPQDAQP